MNFFDDFSENIEDVINSGESIEDKEIKAMLKNKENEDMEEVEEKIKEEIKEETTDNTHEEKKKPKVSTYIGANTIVGDIEGNGYLMILGTTKGSINNLGDAELSGKSYGKIYVSEKLKIKNGRAENDVTANVIETESARIKGNVSAFKSITVDKDTIIIGNIECEELTVYGAIKGNIKAKDVHLKSTGVIKGKIATSDFSYERGAVFDGTFSFDTDVKIDDVFDKF